MKTSYKILIMLLLPLFSFSQGDDCGSATDLGTLPAPDPCPAESGTVVSNNFTTIGATAEFPYTYMVNCLGIGGPSDDMYAPAADVWVEFTASGTVLDLDITSTMTGVTVGLWTGNCGALTGQGCDLSATGNLSTTFEPLTPGVTYLLQISGSSEVDVSDFTLDLENYDNCDICATVSSITATPPPSNGGYAPGTTVQFCFNLDEWVNQVNNWIQGVVPSFGTAWDLSTLTPVSSPGPCSLMGNEYSWFWFTGAPDGDGFYVDVDPSGSSTYDGDYTNNFGDPCLIGTGLGASFCFEITTNAACVPGDDASVSINTFADGEIGAWGSPACLADPEPSTSAFIICCDVPITTSTPPTCIGDSDGEATALGNGGTAPYDYVWEDDLSNVLQTDIDLAGVSTLSGYPAGTYTVTVTDANGCVQSTTVTIVDGPPLPNITASNPGPFCVNGFITVTEDSGEGISWSWSSDMGATITTDTDQTPTITGATTGETFTVTGTDANGCVNTAQTTIVINPLPTVTASNSGPYCENDAMDVTETGGEATSWSWVSDGSATITSPIDQTPTITGAVNGETFTVTGTDANGCVNTAQTTIVIIPTPTISLVGSDPTLCNGTDGFITVDGSVAGNVTVDWSGTSSGNQSGVTLPYDITGLASGTYDVFYTDEATGCITLVSQVVLNNPGAPVIDPIAPYTSCAVDYILPVITGTALTGSQTYYDLPGGPSGGGSTYAEGSTISSSITLYAYDENGPCAAEVIVTITINPLPIVTASNAGPFCIGDPFTITENGGEATSWAWISDGSATITAVGSQTPVITGAVDGETFTVTGTDANSCVNTSQTTVVITPLPTVTATNSGPYCIGDPMDVSETGGQATSWSWVSDMGATITANTDQNPTIVGLDGETFTVTATDANGCVNTAQTTIVINPLPVVTATNSGPYCENDVMDVSETGGAATSWSWVSDMGATITTNTDQNPTIVGVDGETFTVTATDANGCVNTAQTTIVVNALPVVTPGNSGPYCIGDVMGLTESGGEAISWGWVSDGAATITSIGSQNPLITGVVDGEIFTVTLTDANGCVNTGQTTVTINPLPVVTATNSGPVCIDAASFTVSETGGAGTSWSWTSDGAATITANTDQTPTVTGGVDGETFTVTATDANGCVNSANTTIVINPLPTVTATNDGPICAGTPVTLDETGGEGVSWDWTTGGGSAITNNTAQSTTATGAVDGEIFTVTATDANGCVNTATTTVSIIALPALDPITDTIVCDSYTLPVITGTNLTGNEAYFNDTQLNGGTVISGTLTSTQTVYVFDGNGACSDEISFLVTINPLPTVTGVSGGGTYCQGDAVSDILVDVTGNANWTIDYTLDGVAATANAASSPVNLGSAPGVYIVTNVTDANCTNSAAGTETIVVNPIPAAPVAGVDSTYCSTAIYADMTATGSGGTFTWYDDVTLSNSLGNGSNFAPIDQLGSSQYYVTETLLGCEGPASMVTITIQHCDITLPTAITPNGDGINDNWEIVDLDLVYPDNIVRVYNRWGNLIFEHNSSSDGPYDNNRWDGTYKGSTLPVGSYYYLIEFNDNDSNTESGAISILMD